jgi:predicted MFS family arabinose efflux permease
VCAIALLHDPETRNPNAGRVDWAGALAATFGLGGVVYGLLESSTRGWRSLYVYGSFLGGAIALFVFIIIETRSASPMVPIALFKSPSFRGANLLTLLLYAAVGIFFFLFPLNLIQVQGYSATATGAAALPFILLMFFLSRWSGGLVARYGARTPLMIGPFIVALGFLLFALPSNGSNYWLSFFPAFLVLGLGMAVSVAPLTTVVMSSVEQERAGTASGINNAVARVAGVLAIAVLGIVMTWAFNHRLQNSLAGLNLPSDVVHSIQSNSIKLAGIEVPATLDPKTAASVRSAIVQSFISGFRIIMVICALLAIASGLQSVAGAFSPNPAGERSPAPATAD